MIYHGERRDKVFIDKISH